MTTVTTGETAVGTALHLNPLIRIGFDDGVTIELPLRGTVHRVDDPGLLAVLPLLTSAGDVATLTATLIQGGAAADEAQACELISELVALGVLADGPLPPQWAAARHWIDRGWLDALMFHTACQTEAFGDEGTADADAFHDARLAGHPGAQVPSVWTRYGVEPSWPLPPARRPEDLPDLEQTLLDRRSNQPWRKPIVPLPDIATILEHASRETVEVRRRFESTVEHQPSAAMLSPFTALELFVAAHTVAGLPSGLYHYEPDRHRLAQLRAGDLREEMQRMCVGQQRAGSAGALFIIVAVWERFMARYPQPSAYRTLMINVGELAQKLVLVSTATGLSTFITPAFDDAYADQVLGLDPATHAAIEVIGVG